MMHPTLDELQAALPHIRSAPVDECPVEMLCLRPARNQRKIVDRITMTVASGMPGERWLTEPWMRLEDGSPDPSIQVSILPSRVMDLVWRDRIGTPHPGDPIVADIETSYESFPVGTRIAAGTAVLEVSDVFNDGCVKWKTRYGAAAKDWLVLPENRPLRLRGLLCRIVKDGEMTTADRLRRV